MNFMNTLLVAAGENGSLFVFPEGLSFTDQQFVKLFIIMGAFFFMGKASDFICNILGVKKPEKHESLIKKYGGFLGTLGVATAAISGFRTGKQASTDKQQQKGKPINKGRTIASGIFNSLLTTSIAANAARNAKGNSYSAATEAAYKRNSAYLDSAGNGATSLGKLQAYMERVLGGETTAQKIEKMIKRNEEIAKAYGQVKTRASEEFAKKDIANDKFFAALGINDKHGNAIFANPKEFTSNMKAATSQGARSFQYTTSYGTTETIDMNIAERQLGLLNKNAEDILIRRVAGGTLKDDVMAEYIAAANAASDGISGFSQITATTGRDAISAATDYVTIENSRLQRQLGPAKANADATKPR